MFNRSVFRFCQGSQYEDRTLSLKGAATPTAQCMGIAASHQYIAAGYGNGGSVAVLPMDHTAFKRNDSPPLISAHPQALGSLSFSPWDASTLVTGGAEGAVKLWSIPQGGLTESLSAPVHKIDGMGAVSGTEWHPSAANVLAVSHKTGVSILDLNAGVSKYSFPVSGFSKNMLSCAWNSDGSQLAALGVHSALNLFDPRAAAADQLENFSKLPTRKPQNVLFIKDKLALIAQDDMHKPYFAYYDPRDLSKPLKKHGLNYSAGFVLPMYDADTELLFLSMRGSSMTSVYDTAPSKKGGDLDFCEASKLSVEGDSKGACLVPKSAVDTDNCEVQRVLNLTADSVEQYGVKVTRKNKGFAPELYPATRDNTPPANEEQYFGGSNAVCGTVDVLALQSKLGVAKKEEAVKEEPQVAAKKEEAPKPAKVAPAPAKKEEKEEEAKPAASGGSLHYTATDKRKALDNALKGSMYRHLDGKEPRQAADTWYKFPASTGCYLSKNLRCNEHFWVAPTKTGNGSTLAVQLIAKKGRQETPVLLRGHKKPVTAFEVSPTSNVVVSGAQDGEVLCWEIPEGGLTADMTAPTVTMMAPGKITALALSPVVDGLLATGCTGAEGHTVQVWDALQGKEETRIDGFHGDAIVDLKFDDVGSLLATSCKDGKVRVLDIRGRDTVAEFEVKESLRDTQIAWVSQDHILVYGSCKGSRRSLSLWNIRTQECLQTCQHDMSSATHLGHYDPDMRILFTGNNGGTNMEIWQINTEAPYIELLRTYKSPTMFQGSAFVPKRHAVDVKKVVLARSFKLCQDTVVPIEWTVPRKRLEFFQDDLFVDTWDGRALCTATEWFAGACEGGKRPTTVSLKPAGMVPLSEAPKEKLTVRQERYVAHQTKKEEPKKKGVLGHESAEEVAQYFTEVAKEMPKTNRFDATYDDNALDVDEDEWGSD